MFPLGKDSAILSSVASSELVIDLLLCLNMLFINVEMHIFPEANPCSFFNTHFLTLIIGTLMSPSENHTLLTAFSTMVNIKKKTNVFRSYYI